jgi:hypothetical protein
MGMERVADWEILVDQWRNEHSLRDELSHHLVFTKTDTDGEVLQALVRCIGIVMVSDRSSEVPHASPDADRTYTA